MGSYDQLLMYPLIKPRHLFAFDYKIVTEADISPYTTLVNHMIRCVQQCKDMTIHTLQTLKAAFTWVQKLVVHLHMRCGKTLLLFSYIHCPIITEHALSELCYFLKVFPETCFS